jgi:hypothetical protein
MIQFTDEELLRQRLADAEQRAEQLSAALVRARDDMEGWGGYASDYFKEKWGLADDLAAIDEVLR